MSFEIITGESLSGMNKADKFQFLFIFGVVSWICSIALNFFNVYEIGIVSGLLSGFSIICNLSYLIIFIVSEKK